MTWYFPAGIAALAEALISIQRIQVCDEILKKV